MVYNIFYLSIYTTLVFVAEFKFIDIQARRMRFFLLITTWAEPSSWALVGGKTKIKKKKLTARIIITSDSAIWLAETGIFYVIDLRIPKENFNRLYVVYIDLVNVVNYFMLGYCLVWTKLCYNSIIQCT